MAARRSVFGYVHQRKRKDGSLKPGWYIRLRRNGTQTTRWAGLDRKAANELLARLLREASREDLLGEKAIAAASFEETEADFRAYLAARHGATTVTGESGRVARIVSYFGPRLLRETESGHVSELLTTLRKEGRSLATCNRYLSCLSTWFTLAIEKGWARANPVRGLRRPREALKAIPFVGDADVEAILAREPDPLYAAAFRVFADMGLRRSEFARLERADFDRMRQKVAVRVSKAGVPREVALTEKARDAMDALVRVVPLRGTARVWTGSAAMLSRRFAAAAKAAGFALSLHALRHSCASRLAQRNVALPTIGAVLGHKSWQTTARYAHHIPTGATDEAIRALQAPPPARRDTLGDTQATAKASG
jgi:integrase